MANYTVGNLEIAFKTVDKTSASFKDLVKNLRAISALINNISNADISKFANNIESITNSLSPFLTNINEANESLTVFASVTKQLGIKNISKASQEFGNISREAEEAENSTQEFNGAVGESSPTLQEVTSSLKDVNKQLNETKDSGTKGARGFNKFLKSIARIALYRTIRRALQLITQSITETIQEFAKLDDNVNNTMSSITSSLKVIQLSFGTAVLPLLQAIEPIVRDISIAFANFANTISQAMATGDTYWAINADAIRDYREQLEKTTHTLASFDKFNTLNAKDTFSFFEEREVDKENEAVQKTQKIIEGIRVTLEKIWDITKPVLSFIAEHLDLIAIALGAIVAIKIGSEIAKTISKLKNLGSVLSAIFSNPYVAIIAAVVALLGALYVTNEDFRQSVNDLFASFKPLISALGNFFKQTIKPIWNAVGGIAAQLVKVLIPALNALILVMSPMIAYLEAFYKIAASVYEIIGGIFSGDWKSLGKSLKNTWSNWSVDDLTKGAFNNLKNLHSGYDGSAIGGGGGRGRGSELETAYQLQSMATTVAPLSTTSIGTNTSSLKSAFYQALVEWGNTSDNNINLTVNLDGETIYKNTTSHAKRRGQKWA